MKIYNLDISDIQVGSWLHYKMELGEGKTFEKDIQVENIYGDYVNCEVSEYKILSGKYIRNCHPIPLTREILALNGFDISDPEVACYSFSDPTYLIDGKPARLHLSLRAMYDKDNKLDGFSHYICGVLTNIDYVHELQQIMKLAGIRHKFIIK